MTENQFKELIVTNLLRAEYKQWYKLRNDPNIQYYVEGRLAEVELIAACLGINIYGDE